MWFHSILRYCLGSLAELSNAHDLAATPHSRSPSKYLCFGSPECLKLWILQWLPYFWSTVGHRPSNTEGIPFLLAFQAVCTPNPTPVLPLGSPLGSPWGCGWGMWCWGKQTLCSSVGRAESKPFLLPSQRCFWQHLLLPSWHGVKAMTLPVSFKLCLEISVARSCWGKGVCEPRTKHGKNNNMSQWWNVK